MAILNVSLSKVAATTQRPPAPPPMSMWHIRYFYQAHDGLDDAIQTLNRYLNRRPFRLVHDLGGARCFDD